MAENTIALNLRRLRNVKSFTQVELAERAGIAARDQRLTRFDLYVADECFLTGTAAEIVPVVRIDARQIGDGRPGRVTLQLLEMFRKETGSVSEGS